MSEFKDFLYNEGLQGIDKLALFEYGAMIILYEPLSIKSLLRRNVDLWEYPQAEAAMMGVMEWRDNTLYKAIEVDSVRAKHGYGTPMHFLLMQLHPEGIIPTRVAGQNTPDEKRVWERFYHNVGNFVVAEPLENAQHHPEPYLNMRYKLRRPMYNLNMLRRHHKLAIIPDRYEEKSNNLLEFADSWLRREMQRIYGDD